MIANVGQAVDIGRMSTTTHIPVWTMGDRLRKAREDAGLSQAELALEVGVSRATVSNAEVGATTPLPITVNAWARITGVPAEWLRTGRVEDTPRPRSGPRRGTRGQVPIRSDSDTELMQLRYPRHTLNGLLPLKAAA